jgi:hypothetical protein
MIVDGNVILSKNLITNLKGIGKDYLQEITGGLFLEGNPIKSHVLGLLRVKGLTTVFFSPDGDDPLTIIIQKHLKGDRDIMDCHEELTRAGLKQYAQL